MRLLGRDGSYIPSSPASLTGNILPSLLSLPIPLAGATPYSRAVKYEPNIPSESTTSRTAINSVSHEPLLPASVTVVRLGGVVPTLLDWIERQDAIR